MGSSPPHVERFGRKSAWQEGDKTGEDGEEKPDGEDKKVPESCFERLWQLGLRVSKGVTHRFATFCAWVGPRHVS